MPLLYESVFSVSAEKAITVEEAPPPEFFTCPICNEQFDTEELMLEHIKTKHPWHWHFWYAPYGKALLGFTAVAIPAFVLATYGVSLKWR